MVSFLEILSPSFLLFPALLGSAILALVCPLVGAHLMLRRRVFLGLTLPQIAACGVAGTFWLHHALGFTHGTGGERLLGMAGSLLFTLVGMGLLAYLDRHATGSPEGRLAAAYALASAITILFIVFNPAGELEILNLLKGEVISLSKDELKLLALVYGLVYVGLVLFRREFLLNSFDRDLSFLLTGGSAQWNFWLYVLCGFSIAVGVIMAGPLLVFGFMVLPPLAARTLARGMGSFLSLSSIIGLVTAVWGFYLSVQLDLPLGPTDVALGCGAIFLAYGLKRVSVQRTTLMLVILLGLSLVQTGCGGALTNVPVPEPKAGHTEQLWLAQVKNSTDGALVLPESNPLRSLAEMAGRLAPDARATVMNLLRENLRSELQQKGFIVALPEQKDARFPPLPADPERAVRLARDGGLSGVVFISEIWRWEGETQKFVRALVDFKLVRIDDGTIVWRRRVQRAVPTPSATNLGQASTDAAKAIVHDLFAE